MSGKGKISSEAAEAKAVTEKLSENISVSNEENNPAAEIKLIEEKAENGNIAFNAISTGKTNKENSVSLPINPLEEASENAENSINAADKIPADDNPQETAEDGFVAPDIIKAEEKKPLKLNLSRHIIAGAVLVIALLVLFISRANRDFADWFCFNVYPVFSGIGSHIWGVFPFSVAEILVALVILGSLTGLVFLVRYVIKQKGQRLKAFLNGFSWAEAAAAILFLTVTFNCLVGYNRTPFSQYSGLTLREYSAEELKELTLYLIDKANEIAENVDLDSEGRPVKPKEFNNYAIEAMESLGEKYEVLKTYYPQPKAVTASSLMSSFNLAGIYFPVTVEANFNQAMPVSSQGFTACHELSHLSGFIREDEANFIAFMACRESGSTFFRYSGYLGALTYALNALHGAVSSEEYSEVCGKLSSVIRNEYAYRNEYWSPYQKKVTYKVSSAVNDTYLKANNQTDGTKSYGRIVDLMLAEYFGEG